MNLFLHNTLYSIIQEWGKKTEITLVEFHCMINIAVEHRTYKSGVHENMHPIGVQNGVQKLVTFVFT